MVFFLNKTEQSHIHIQYIDNFFIHAIQFRENIGALTILMVSCRSHWECLIKNYN